MDFDASVVVRYLFTLMAAFLISGPTFAQEQQNKSHFVCWTGQVENSKDRIAYYANSREECSRGEVRLVYEQFAGRSGERKLYKVSHEIRSYSNCPKFCIYITRCLNEKDEYRYHILQVDLNLLTEEFFSTYNRAWSYEKEPGFLIPTSEFLVCRNNGYDN